MFPPGNARPDVALAEHLRHRQAWYADLIGPLLVPAGAFDAFAAAHRAAGSPAVTVVLIATTTLPPAVPDSLTIAGFEVAVADVPLPRTGDRLSLAAEVTTGAGGDRVLVAVGEQAAGGRPVVAKLRTGGVERAAFPSEDSLAGALASAFAARAPVKLTAGLHRAVRYTDSQSGFEHHGFLNVLLAVVQTLDGRDAGTTAATLAIRDQGVVLARIQELPGERLMAARRWFVSFGCCGVDEPVDDLVGLGLVESGVAASRPGEG